MNIKDYAAALNLTLTIRMRINCPEADRWYASFDGVDVKEDVFLVGNFGNGSTPQQAVNNYVKKIRNKTIVLNAFKESRREYTVPETLEGIL